MNEQQEGEKTEDEYPTSTFKNFLESSSPYHPVIISDLWHMGGRWAILSEPDVQLLCENDSCQGMRFFEYKSKIGDLGESDKTNYIFLEYRCKNCERTTKIFSLIIFKLYKDYAGLTAKVGEWPPFAPKTPPRLLNLLGSDKELFLQGRRAEYHGLGIGAFTYYRRVVENQKNRLLDEIIKVVEKVEPTSVDIVKDLNNAKNTFQFTQSIDDAKLAIPQVLFVDGHNPLLMLHNTLSDGIHAKSDNECLELARSIRLVLSALMERIDLALSENKELHDAVSKLMKYKAGKCKKDS